MGKLNGLDLFSGLGGISVALEPWVTTVAYCEQDPHAQGVLLSRMLTGDLEASPIWDDITTLSAAMLPKIDIIFGGFPCQDISAAGRGAGLDGKRSGLFFEVLRLVDECKPKFLFLENVPAIRTRGLGVVLKELARRGYDCRWTVLSAEEVGAPHKRQRWFLLARGSDTAAQSMADSACVGRSEGWTGSKVFGWRGDAAGGCAQGPDFWLAEPDVGRVVNGLPHRVDRITRLGNAVVPLQAQQAFKELLSGHSY